ncbi:MAG: hypothetical protein II145_03175 [Selenomonas sp.]|nr:hypothetical protein [Selenomonas sp.]
MSRSENITMHRCLSAEEAGELVFSPLAPQAVSEGQSLELTPEGNATDNTYAVQPADNWNPDETGFVLEQKFTLGTLQLLFAGSAGGIAVALPGDTLGIMATWWSSQSDISGCEKIDTFTAAETAGGGNRMITFRKEFAAGLLRGTLQVHYHLYLAQKGPNKKPGFASESGTLLGEIGTPLTILLDGTGSSFPMSVTEAGGRPLWWTEINISDPFEEPFNEEYFNLVLNAAHPDYEALNGRGRKKKNTFDSPLFREVLAGAIEEFFLYLRQNYRDQFDGLTPDEVPEGSIAAAALYMKQYVDTSDMLRMHETVRQMLEKQLGDTLQKEVSSDEMEDAD